MRLSLIFCGRRLTGTWLNICTTVANWCDAPIVFASMTS